MMKHIKLFEQFINEGKHNTINMRHVWNGLTTREQYKLLSSIHIFNMLADKYAGAMWNKLPKDIQLSLSPKLVSMSESVNEAKYNTVKKVVSKLGKSISPKDLAKFVKDNFYDVTGTEEMDSGDADEKIADLVGFYKLDPMEWEEAWAEVTESVNEIITDGDVVIFKKVKGEIPKIRYNSHTKEFSANFLSHTDYYKNLTDAIHDMKNAGFKIEKHIQTESVNEAEKPLYKKGQKVQYKMEYSGGVGAYADSKSESPNVKTGVIRSRKKTLSSYKYVLSDGMTVYQSEIIGLA